CKVDTRCKPDTGIMEHRVYPDMACKVDTRCKPDTGIMEHRVYPDMACKADTDTQCKPDTGMERKACTDIRHKADTDTHRKVTDTKADMDTPRSPVLVDSKAVSDMHPRAALDSVPLVGRGSGCKAGSNFFCHAPATEVICYRRC
ncbi:MAG: hypothetical protein ACMUIM_09575, partial [bacterium]